MLRTSATTLAIDIGGSGSRALLIDKLGRKSLHETGRPSQAESGLDTVKRVVLDVKDRCGLAQIDRVRAGVTGLNGRVPEIDDFALLMAERAGVVDLIVADDSVPWALGALGGKPGVTVAIGTGIVALGVGARGRLSHVDGSGPYLGDRGSGWWVGRQGLIAAIAADEKRAGGSPRLLRAAQERFGDLTRLAESLRRDINPHATIASFAIDVAAAADSGDIEGVRIFADLGRYVATAVAAAARRSGLAPDHNLALVGGLSNASALFDTAMNEGLAAEGFHPTPRTPISDALQGALLLDRVADDPFVVRRWKREEPSE